MISVIIPTHEEAEELPRTLEALRMQGLGLGSGSAGTVPEIEVVVVDASSADGTGSLAREAGARVVESERMCRAQQMNLGATAARGDIFWFLHADTWVPPLAAVSVVAALEDPSIVGGGFGRRFRSASPFLLATCACASVRSRCWGLYFGDQSIFAKRSVFETVQGFPDVPVFEDFEFCQRLRTMGKLRYLTPAVKSSARRFQKRGALAVTLHDLWLTLRYHAGEDPQAIWDRLQAKKK